jgi:hypothetical protein
MSGKAGRGRKSDISLMARKLEKTMKKLEEANKKLEEANEKAEEAERLTRWTCSFCLQTLNKEGRHCVLNPCKHVFCETHHEWLAMHNANRTCPICQQVYANVLLTTVSLTPTRIAENGMSEKVFLT